MEDTALCVRLSLFILLLLAAHVHHNNAEKTAGSVLLESPLFPVMEGDDVTLRCRSKMSLINLTANFYKDDVLINCSATGYMTIHSVTKSDEGLYKCNISGAGESPVSWLSVTASAVILDSPIHPVMEGDSVTLRCRKKKTPTDHIADFYNHGFYIGTGYNGEMTIRSVSKSDEGPLKCSISGAGDSPERWLTVTGCPNKAVHLCSDQLPVLLYLLIKTVATIM
ncbi:low affinity immunoglobulin gamma Fc region receptor III-A-like isoform X2 [Channa argus]|uniref:low affinity immunoglobulin gamma Fc region receptor III-A-like isoform X2 n=1 Tax=Channa argus TaxID=215402 RepID=UPI003521906A